MQRAGLLAGFSMGILEPLAIINCAIRGKASLMAKTQKNQRRWTKAEEKLLGAKPDAEVASILGRSQFAVQIRRHSLGIPARSENRSAWTPQEDKLLGTLPDSEVAKILG